MISCSSTAENDFEKIVTRVNEYLSGKLILLTSTKSIRNNEETYVYYSLRVEDYNLTYDVREDFRETSRFRAYITISCKASDNADSGDSTSNLSGFSASEGIMPTKARGFSTTSMALANQYFSNNSKPMTIITRYSHQENEWFYDSISVSGVTSSESLVDDLKNFPQNKAFREAFGMSN